MKFSMTIALTVCLLCSLKHFGQQPAVRSEQLLSGQGAELVVSGRVLDEKGEPTVAVSVYASLLQKPMAVVKGCMPDSTGNFMLRLPGGSEYILTVSGVGYKKYSTKTDQVSGEQVFGDIVMEEANYRIGEVVVRPLIEVTADKIIFNIESDPDRAASDMYKMIQKMPLIEVDQTDGRIYVKSPEKTYVVLRKGRLDGLFDFTNMRFDDVLQKLPAMGFSTFEIWTVVPSRFGEYDYAINILPDPNARLFGATGANEARYDANAGLLSLSQAINGSADKIRFTGNFSFNNLNAPKTRSTSSILFYPDETVQERLITQRSEKRSSGEAYNLNFAMSTDISERQFLTISFRGLFNDSRSRGLIRTDSLAGGINTAMQSNNLSLSDMRTLEGNVTYELGFKKIRRILNISYLAKSLPISREDRLSVAYENDAGNDREQSVSSDEQNTTHRLQLNYSDDFKNGKYRVSTQAGYLITNFDRENHAFTGPGREEDMASFIRLQQNLHRIDGFVNLIWNPANSLSVFSTLNADYLPGYNVTKVTTVAGEEEISQKELLLSPTGGFQFKFNIRQPQNKKDEGTEEEKMIRQVSSGISPFLSAGMGNSEIRFRYANNRQRPSIHHLASYNIDNPLIIQRGNPRLEVVSRHSFDLSLSSWFKISPRIFYGFSDNMIVPLTVSETTETGTRLVSSFFNAGKSRNFNFSAIYNNFSARQAVGTIRFSIPTVSLVYTNTRTNFGYGTFSKDIRLSLGTACNLTAFEKITGSVKLAYIGITNSGAIGANDSKPFSMHVLFNMTQNIGTNRLQCGLVIGDIINWSGKKSSFSNMPDFESVSESATDKLPLSFNIRYTYGKFKVKPLKQPKAKATIEGFSEAE